MNSITVAGTLGRDAELRYLPNGDAVTSFSVADSQGRDKPTVWWNASLFGKRAESLTQYLIKGSAVTISGSVAEREWTDKDGQKRKSMDIRVSDVALQGGRKEDTQAKPAPQPQRSHQTTSRPASGFDDMSSDIPF